MSSQVLSTDGSFRPTRWTLVWRARGEGKEAFRALSELCAIYHYPLYCFARRQGLGPQDAEDATPLRTCTGHLQFHGLAASEGGFYAGWALKRRIFHPARSALLCSARNVEASREASRYRRLS